MAQAQVTVTSADPSSAVQGTVSLDVTVNGNGFDSTAQVKFLVTGTADPGGITVKKVAVKGSKRLVATVDVADTAAVNKFDIEVALSNGRKGKGTTLFSVQAKVATGPCASATDPAFAFTTRPGKYQTPQVYVADASGACTKLVGSLIDGPYYYPWPHRVSYRLLPLTADGRRTGRIATHEQNRGIVLMQFSVDPSVPGMELQGVQQVALGRTPAAGGVELSPDGRRLAVVETLFDWPNAGDYTYRLLVADVDACIADIPNCSFATAYVQTGPSDGLGLVSPRWGSDGRIYLEKRTGRLIDPTIVRVSADPPYSTGLELLVQPSGSRLALFDVQSNGSDDLIVFAETTPSITSYCYKVKTALASSCNPGSCAVHETNLTVSYYTSVEAVGATMTVLTQPVSRSNCATGPSIARGEAVEGSPATIEPLISKGEMPASAD